jgi:hypothetical protein
MLTCVSSCCVDDLKHLLKHLKKEGAIVPAGFSRWMELKSDNSVGRKKAVEELGDFVDSLAKSK